MRKVKVGVVAKTNQGTYTLKRGNDVVTMSGNVIDLVMFAFGRSNKTDIKFEGEPSAIDKLKKYKYIPIIVTNQPDVESGRGPLTYDDLDTMHLMIKKWLRIENIYYSEDRGSDTYKPNNGMVEYFINKYKVDRSQSYMIGDTWKDIVAGHKSYLTTIFVGEEYVYPFEHKDKQPDFIVNSALEAATLIEEMNKE